MGGWLPPLAIERELDVRFAAASSTAKRAARWLKLSWLSTHADVARSTNNMYNMYVYIYIYVYIYTYMVGGFNPSEKYESQWEGLSHVLWKIKNVWNHQPYIYMEIEVLTFTQPEKNRRLGMIQLSKHHF